MYYSTVEIRPSINKLDWEVFYYDMPYDREAGQGSMSGLGFYHYPRKMGQQAAFDALKVYMIQRHKDEIAKLQKSLELLEGVQSGLKSTSKKSSKKVVMCYS